MADNAEVIIIGAGLIGLSIAYHLASKGISNVVVIEKESLWGHGSSGRSAGGIRLEFSHPSAVKFSQYGLEMFRHFEELFGISASFNPCGYLFLTRDPGKWNVMQNLSFMQQSLGVPVTCLSPQEVSYRFPYVQIPDLVGATFCPDDGVADPGAVLYGFAKRAMDLGVTIRLGEQVTGILVHHDQIAGVKTSKGMISGRVVVNAAGPYARSVGHMVGVEIPVHPYRRNIYVTTPFMKLPQNMPMTLDLETTSYLRRDGDSILLGMSDPDEPSSYHTETDHQALEKLIETLLHWVPILADASILRGWAGLYEVSPDDTAIIGEVEGISGFYCANGFSGHGFMHSPAAGRVIAELITGEEPFVDLKPFLLKRFTDNQPTTETFVI
ncbi:NAD(P)/FAD-dependent oxidoreductase [Sulfobacillus thermosulfidooxidans]|uniref:NAD(P)/FAD-dependent oxidoreductase n=1 Tax=Sulfobacillus thermosulfidooxidans TaxID=28034 RepID=UPI0006B69808|nr:FAD-binding oxidoreductase [Sulfobacillus thermosulfidooxidans]